VFPLLLLRTCVWQVMAEMQAGTVLHHYCEPQPTMCLPMGLDLSPMTGGFTFSVYAGESLDTLLAPGGEWHRMTPNDKLLMAKSFAATTLLVRQMNDELVSVCEVVTEGDSKTQSARTGGCMCGHFINPTLQQPSAGLTV